MTAPVQIGDCTLYLGDCLDILPGLSGVDAVVTDPPWMDYETGRYDASEWHTPIAKVDPSKYSDRLFNAMRDGAAAILWCRWDCFAEHSAAMTAAGLSVKNCIVWAKPNHTAGDLEGNLGAKHEMAVFATRGRWRRHSSREVNLWTEGHLFSRSQRSHPTEKPIPLMERSTQAVCDRGGTVLDPFMGSGTTGVACVRTGRKFIGCEIEPRYFDISCKRIEAEYAKAPLFAEAS